MDLSNLLGQVIFSMVLITAKGKNEMFIARRDMPIQKTLDGYLDFITTLTL